MKRTIRRNTPEEEAAIQGGIDADPDAREMTDEEYANARPASEVMPAAVYNELVLPRRRGPGAKPRKAQVTFRLDQDVVEGLRATGHGWQSRANEALRKLVKG
jgi:uncharacterized protein (DUF4415 family)